jgi:acyl carrier protein
METKEIFNSVVKIITPYARNKEALESVTDETTILNDLDVNSSRLVDVVLAMEDEFDIEISDDEVDKVSSIGNAVNMINEKMSS